MFKAIFQSDRTIKEKTEELKRLTSHPDFLSILKDPDEFLEELIPFVNQVFKEIPADSSMSFGPENEMRVFYIRLLTKLDYKGYSSHLLLEMIYNLFATENIFNRYLTLKILFPLLDSDIFIDPNIHLKSINSFFKNELPTNENYDNSRCKLGFFSVAEALNYLKHFQLKFNVPMELYEEILYSLTGAFKIYFVQRYIEEFYHNKKISCEFCSMGINLFEFINELNIPTSHYIIPFIPELCYTLCNMCPRDCVLLQCDVLDTVMNTFTCRKDILFNLDKYFLKNSYLVTDSPFLKIKNLTFLSNLMKDFNRNMTKIVFSEFDSRICEYIPLHKDVPLLIACVEAFTVNLIAALKYPLDPIDLKILIVKHIKTANKIYRRLHLPIHCQYSEASTPAPITSTDDSLDFKFMSCLKVFIKALTTIQLPKPLDWEDILILGQLLLFPLTREMPCFDYLALFNEFPIETLEIILLPIIDDLMIHFHSQIFSWNVLMKIPEIFSVFIKAANVLIHKDFISSRFFSIDFYRKIFPISYGFFKIDKRFIKSECNELFSCIFDLLLRFNPLNYNVLPSLDTKMCIGLINSMFLDIKSCEIAYTGLYFIYDTFEITVNELYTLYTLSFDSFYLECLFNIPVSLNLLVTKYSILVPPMVAGLKSSKKLREIVMKYVEYIIEFDTEDGGMADLLVLIFNLLQEHSLKGINVLSRISNKHREILNSGELRGHRLTKCNNLCIKRQNSSIFKADELYLDDGSLEKNEISTTITRALNIDLGKPENKLWNESAYQNSVVNSIQTPKPGNVKSIVNQKNESLQCSEYFSIPCDELKRLSIPALIGYEFYHEESMRKLAYSCSSSRILKGVGHSNESAETARSVLIDYILRLVRIDGLFSDDKTHLMKTSRILQSISDIAFALLLDDHSSPLEILKSICLSLPLEFLCEFIIDGLVYSFDRTNQLLDHVFLERSDEANFCIFIHKAIYTLIDSIYSTDNLKSHRSFDALNSFLKRVTCFDTSEEMAIVKNLLYCVFFKMKRCESFRIYQIALSISLTILNKIGFEAICVFEKISEKLNKLQNSYVRVLIYEVKATYNMLVTPEILPELDKRCFVQLFQYQKDSILKIENLPMLCESFLKEINKKDVSSIRKFVGLLDKIRDEESLFAELLTPVKKYLPPIAVLEGFASLEARRKFVENVNRNGNFQIQNPNSLKVFRNLFYDCKINGSIKSSVIDFLNTSGLEHRTFLLEILLNCVEYDLPSFDFLITKLSELPLLNVSHILGLSTEAIQIFETLWLRISSQPDHVREVLLVYLMERMNVSFIYNFVEYCVPINTQISNILTNLLNEFLNTNHSVREQHAFSKSAYNILRYLKKKKCRFNDNKAVLIVYRDLHGIELEIDDLVNWYFKNFNPEDIEVLFRINSCFLITSNFLITKLALVESTSTRNWMLNCLKKHLGTIKHQCINSPEFIDSKYSEVIQKSPYLENSRLIDCNSFLFKCLSSYLKFKGLPIFENPDQKPLEATKNFHDFPFELENDSADLISFTINGESMSSSDTDLSLFIDNEKSQTDSEDLFENENSIRRGEQADDYHTNKDFTKNNMTDGGSNLGNVKNNPNFCTAVHRSNFKDSGNIVYEYKLSDTKSSVNTNSNASESVQNTQAVNEDYYIVSLQDLSSILPLFYESINVIIELFCDLRIYSQELVHFCLSTPQASYRFASLFYLSMFNPQPEFFDEIFKLNYQESKYIISSLKLLVDNFGTKQFQETVKTVLRSEMRFKTSEFILIPFLLSEPKFFEDQELLFEVCVFTKRLLGKETINYSLINFLNSVPTISSSFKEDINTQTILIEISKKKQDLYNTLNFDRKVIQATSYPKIFALLENDLANKPENHENSIDSQRKLNSFESNASSLNQQDVLNSNVNNHPVKDPAHSEKERFVRLNDQKFTFNNGVFVKERQHSFDRNVFVKIFIENPTINLSKLAIMFLNLPFSVYLNSTVENQMSILEIFTNKEDLQSISDQSSTFFQENDSIIVKFLNNIVMSKYPNLTRFNNVYPKLIKVVPSIVEWLVPLIVDNEFVYPPLFEFLPEIFEICSPELAVMLCSKRPANIPVDTVEMNTLHLFKILPFSLDTLKLDFFNGLLSKNKFTRQSYLDFFMSHIPRNPFACIQFIFLFNFNNLDEAHVEYIIMAILYKVLIKSNEITFDSSISQNEPGSIDSNGNVENITNQTINSTVVDKNCLYNSEIYQHLMASVPSFSDLIVSLKDVAFSSIPSYCVIVESLLTGFLNSLSHENILNLHRLFTDNFHQSFSIKLPFYRAFISCGMPTSDFVFNPYTPSPKFYQLTDRELYLGLVKSKGGLREVKSIVKSIENNDENETLNLIFDLFRKVAQRQASYNMEDLDFLEGEVKKIYLENGIPYSSIFKDKNLEASDKLKNSSTLPCFTSHLHSTTEIEQIELKFNKVLDGLENDRNILDDVKGLVNSLSMMSYVPRSTLLFSKLLMFASVTSEIVESSIILKDNLTDSIFGRFRMWMNRHPSFLVQFIDWNLFMRWRTFIFNKALSLVAENDKKKISTEICKLNCIYSSKAFREKLYARSSAILNEVSSITSVEINQNMHRTLLDLENLFYLKEYNTMISLINSLNITKFSNEEKSRLYYWMYKALKKLGKNSDSEKYGALSRKLCEIIENKKDDLEIIKERIKFRMAHEKNLVEENFASSGFFSLFPSMSNSELENSYINKLIEIANEVSIEDSRPYIMELLKYSQSCSVSFESISHRKLYFFIPQFKNIDFLLMKNPLLRSSLESVELFTKLYYQRRTRASEQSRVERTSVDNSMVDGNSDDNSESSKKIQLNTNKRAKVAYRTSREHSKPNNLNKKIPINSSCNNSELISSNKENVNEILRKLLDEKVPNIHRIEELAEELFIQQIRESFTNKIRFSSFFFEKDTVLPGEFSVIRSKYDDLKIMEYIEDDLFNSIDDQYSSSNEFFFVRNVDGSLCKVVAQENDSNYLQSPLYFQFIQFFHDVLNNFVLERLNAKCAIAPTFISKAPTSSVLDTNLESVSSAIENDKTICFSVHKNVSSSVDLLLKLQVLKREESPSSLYTKFLKKKISSSPLVALCESISKFKFLLRDHILDTVVDFNDFYTFKRNFINSYSSTIFFQYLLNLNSISLENTFLDQNGNCYMSAISSKKDKFYLRPNFQMIFGAEGINGPLHQIFNEFLNVSCSDLAIDSFVFFGMGTINDIKKKTGQIASSKDEDSVNLIISDMIDPKCGVSLPNSDVPWL